MVFMVKTLAAMTHQLQYAVAYLPSENEDIVTQAACEVNETKTSCPSNGPSAGVQFRALDVNMLK
jgi:hypothetical protein